MKPTPTNPLMHLGSAVMLMLLSIAGCQPQHPDDPGHAASGPTALTLASSTASPPCEYFLLLADGLSAEIRASLQAHLGQLIVYANPGDVIHVVRTPDHAILSTIVIPQAVGRDRLRDAALTAGLGPVKAFLDDGSTVPGDYRCQLGLPKLLDTFWGVRQTSFATRIVLVGSPVFHDPTALQWSFRNGRFPTDRSLTDDESTLPLRCPDRVPLPADAQVILVVDDVAWADGVHHQNSLIRFYNLAFKRHLGGQFLRLTSDVAGGFERDIQPSFPEFADFDTALTPQMLVATDSAPIPVESFGDVPAEVQEAIETAKANPQQILIAINWASRDSLTDVDIWLKSIGCDAELNYIDMSVDFGRLIRDVRTPGNPDSDDYGNWEVAIVNHDRLSDLTLWLNAFAGTGPSQVRLITVWKGNKTEREFPFAFRFGDRAMGVDRRSTASAWMGPIDLTASPTVVAER